MDKKDVLNRIEEEIGAMTKLQKRVADYVLKNPMEVAFATVDKVAHSVGSSTTTVMRFSNFMGYGGYSEFQAELRESLKTKASPSRKLEVNLEDGDAVDKESDIIAKITNMQMENIHKTFLSVDREALIKVEQMLSKSSHTYVTGSRSCYSPAYHLNYNLERMFGKSDLIPPNLGEVSEILRRIQDGDVLVAMTVARYNRIICDITKIAKERGAKIIVITDGYDSPLEKYADVVFIASCQSVDFHNSMTAVSYITDLIVGVCTMNHPKIIKHNLKLSETYLKELDIMVK